MITVSDLKKRLPFRDWNILITNNQDDLDIIREILSSHNEFSADYDHIYQDFYTGDIYTTCERIWNFLKSSFKYNAESKEDQTVRSPYRILENGGKIDCKHYSLFIGGILGAIQRNVGGNWHWCYRFASYNYDPVAAHVFVVVTDWMGEIWVDPVLSRFNEDKLPTFIKDKKPMALHKVAGPEDNGKSIVVPLDKAFNSFLVMLNIDAFNLKELILAHPEITQGPVYQYMIEQSFDFDHFLTILKAPTQSGQ